jgi:hypothetical protein
MKKKAKKLELSKETLRGLDLERVVGANHSDSDMYRYTCFSNYSNCQYACDMPETTFPTCIA